MPVVVLLLLILVVAAIGVVAAGRGDTLGEAPPDRSPRGELPPGPIDPDALENLRFTVAFRGYRMDEVDEVLDRLAAELEDKSARLAELEGDPSRVDARDQEA